MWCGALTYVICVVCVMSDVCEYCAWILMAVFEIVAVEVVLAQNQGSSVAGRVLHPQHTTCLPLTMPQSLCYRSLLQQAGRADSHHHNNSNSSCCASQCLPRRRWLRGQRRGRHEMQATSIMMLMMEKALLWLLLMAEDLPQAPQMLLL